MSHTPGPLTITHNGLMIAKTGDLDTIIGHCYDNPVRAVDGYANARLWAAAPELFEACEAFLRFMDTIDVATPGLNSKLYKQAYMAIAKAKGGVK